MIFICINSDLDPFNTSGAKTYTVEESSPLSTNTSSSTSSKLSTAGTTDADKPGTSLILLQFLQFLK